MPLKQACSQLDAILVSTLPGFALAIKKLKIKIMKEKLSIQEVAQILNRSTKSIRNYVKSGKLQSEKINGSHGPEFIFRIDELRNFAQNYLSLAIDNKTVESLVKPRKTTSTHSSKAVAPKELSLSNFADKLIALEAEKRKIIEDYAEYKAQLAFKMGQMESKLKLLDTARSERNKLKQKIRYLEQKTTKQLTELDELQKARSFYEHRPWFLAWKKYKSENAKVVA